MKITDYTTFTEAGTRYVPSRNVVANAHLVSKPGSREDTPASVTRSPSAPEGARPMPNSVCSLVAFLPLEVVFRSSAPLPLTFLFWVTASRGVQWEGTSCLPCIFWRGQNSPLSGSDSGFVPRNYRAMGQEGPLAITESHILIEDGDAKALTFLGRARVPVFWFLDRAPGLYYTNSHVHLQKTLLWEL